MKQEHSVHVSRKCSAKAPPSSDTSCPGRLLRRPSPFRAPLLTFRRPPPGSARPRDAPSRRPRPNRRGIAPFEPVPVVLRTGTFDHTSFAARQVHSRASRCIPERTLKPLRGPSNQVLRNSGMQLSSNWISVPNHAFPKCKCSNLILFWQRPNGPARLPC